MFSLVALMCFYLGTNNIRKAFALAPFDQWVFINWALFAVGVILLPVGVFCLLQAMKDFKVRKAEKEAKEKAEKEKRQRQFFYDDEIAGTEETAENDEENN